MIRYFGTFFTFDIIFTFQNQIWVTIMTNVWMCVALERLKYYFQSEHRIAVPYIIFMIADDSSIKQNWN